LILLPVLVTGVFASTLWHDFVYDDDTQIGLNPHLRSSEHIPTYFTADVWAHRTPVSGGRRVVRNLYYRPWFLTMYFLQYQAFGLNPMPWHGVNILLHLGFVLAAWRCFRRVGMAEAPSVFGAALVAVLPVNSEAVNWIAAQCDLWMAVALSSSFLLFLRWKERGGWLASSGAMLLFSIALLSKETAVVYCLILWAHTILFPRQEGGRRFLLPVLSLVLVAAYLGVRTAAVGPPASTGGTLPHHPLLLVPALLGKYFSLLVFPLDLRAVYPKAGGLSLAYILPGIGGAALYFAMGVLSLGSHGWRRSLFLATWLVVPLLPTLFLGGLGQNLLAERYLYFSSLGFAGLVAGCAARLGFPPSRLWLTPAVLSILVLTGSTIRTVARNPVWKDDYILMKTTLEGAPESLAVRYNYALQLAVVVGDDEGAEEQFLILRKRFPGYGQARVAYGTLLSRMGRKEEAILEWKAGLVADPANQFAALKLGTVMEARGRYREAAHYYGIYLQNALPDQGGKREEIGKRLAFLEGRSR
jgi:hypothetical protein